MTKTGNSLKEKVERYIHNMEKAISTINVDALEPAHSHIVDLSRRYLEDAKYYLDNGDVETAAFCIAYAEGLIDALRHMGIVEFEWPMEDPKTKPRVLVGGTFDILHPGHIYLLTEAAKHGRVYVIVARDSNSIKYKGRKPIVGEKQRLYMMKNLKQVYEAMLGEDDPIDGIVKVNPDIIVLGPDQALEEEYIRSELKARGLRGIKIIRLSKRTSSFEHCSSSSIIEEIVRRYCK